jgi:hypothetical protein
MPRTVEIRKGQTFQDGTGLTVRVGEIDASERVHFAVIKDRESVRRWRRRNVLFRVRPALYQN